MYPEEVQSCLEGGGKCSGARFPTAETTPPRELKPSRQVDTTELCSLAQLRKMPLCM